MLLSFVTSCMAGWLVDRLDSVFFFSFVLLGVRLVVNITVVGETIPVRPNTGGSVFVSTMRGKITKAFSVSKITKIKASA